MKKTLTTLSFTVLSLLITGCKTSSDTTNTSNGTPATPVTSPEKYTVELSEAKIKDSGRAEPVLNNNQVVGYEFKKGFVVPAQLGNYFGFSYRVNQSINATADQSMQSSYVASQVPVTITVTHPEIIINGKAETVSSWQDTLYFGRDNFVTWKFESKNELVSGKWHMDVSYKQKSIANKNFFVQVPPKLPNKVTQVCQIEIKKFPKFLQTANTDCCENNNAQACYNFAWRGLERIKDKNGAKLYYAKSCDLGDASGCRQSAKMADSSQKRDAFYHKGCDLKDIDSCLEVNRLPN